jgi:hypothetical protein
MAIIKCPECGREISDKAAACPQCGCPQEAAAFGGPTGQPWASPPPLPPPIPLRLEIPGLLTNPGLPRVANWICVYFLAVNPAFLILWLILTLPFGPPSNWLQIDTAIGVVLIISGLKLKRLQASARQWVTWGLYASLAITAYEVCSAMFGSTGDAEGDISGGLVAIFLLVLVLEIADVAFRIVALVWLHRHGHELPVDESGCQ